MEHWFRQRAAEGIFNGLLRYFHPDDELDVAGSPEGRGGRAVDSPQRGDSASKARRRCRELGLGWGKMTMKGWRIAAVAALLLAVWSAARWGDRLEQQDPLWFAPHEEVHPLLCRS